MPLLRRPYSRPYDHERHRSWPAALGALTVLLAAGLIGWAIGQHDGTGTTRTVTRSVTMLASPPSAHQHTPQGAVAAAEANLVEAETSCVGGGRCASPAYSLGPDGGGLWSLAYRIESYSPLHAVVQAWQLQISAGGPAASTLAWELAHVPVSWTGARWTQIGQVSQAAAGPTPPPDQTDGARSRSFAQTIATFSRFPGAP